MKYCLLCHIHTNSVDKHGKYVTARLQFVTMGASTGQLHSIEAKASSHGQASSLGIWPTLLTEITHFPPLSFGFCMLIHFTLKILHYFYLNLWMTFCSDFSLGNSYFIIPQNFNI